MRKFVKYEKILFPREDSRCLNVPVCGIFNHFYINIFFYTQCIDIKFSKLYICINFIECIISKMKYFCALKRIESTSFRGMPKK